MILLIGQLAAFGGVAGILSLPENLSCIETYWVVEEENSKRGNCKPCRLVGAFV